MSSQAKLDALVDTIMECERRIAAARREKLRAIAEFCRCHEQDEFAAAELALAASVDQVLRQHAGGIPADQGKWLAGEWRK